jgi:predicted transcriptional regulator of viral defense system
MNLMALIKKLEKTSVAEIRDVTSEQFGIEKDTLDSMLADLEAKGKIKRLDDGYVKAI